MAQTNIPDLEREQLRVGPYSIDAANPTISGPEGRQKLSPLAVRLLLRLAASAPREVSRADFVADLWDGNDLVGEPALNRLVSEIRAAAALVASAPLIVTVPRSGYRLAAPVQSTKRSLRANGMRLLTPTTLVLIVAIVASSLLAALHIQQRPATSWETTLEQRTERPSR